MKFIWQQFFFYGMILNSVLNTGNCQDREKCQTLDDCYGSTGLSQFYYTKYLDPSSPDYNPYGICENSNPVKIWCNDFDNSKLKQDSICGQVISEEIITGPKTKVNEFPWMALLQYTNGEIIETSCQGVLISYFYVITTATCITRNTNGFVLASVRLGEWDTTTIIDCDNSSGVLICNKPPIVLPVEKTIIHQNFNESRDYRYNIGMIQMKYGIEYTDFIKPICIPQFLFLNLKRYFYVGRKFEIASWGETSPAGKRSEILLKVDLEGFSCPNDFSSLCIQGTRKRNVCNGDEGAPIMGHTTLGNRTYVYLAGIVSQNNSCGAFEGPIFLGESADLGYWSIGKD